MQFARELPTVWQSANVARRVRLEEDVFKCGSEARAN